MNVTTATTALNRLISETFSNLIPLGIKSVNVIFYIYMSF